MSKQQAPKLDQKFIDLQNKWYAKLKQDGFQDIEWLDKKTGLGQNSDTFVDGKHAAKAMKHYSPQIAYFYAVLQNYYTHNWNGELRIFRDKRQQYAIREMLKGVSYRPMVAAYNKTRLAKRTGKIYTFLICRTIQKFTAMAFKWNSQSDEGIKPHGTDDIEV